MSTCADVGSVIESKMSAVQTPNVGFTSEVSDYLVVHTGPVEDCSVNSVLVLVDVVTSRVCDVSIILLQSVP